MKKLILSALLLLCLTLPAAEPKKVLVVTVTTEFRHSSIERAEKILQKLADESKAFVIADFARQPAIKIPEKPSEPRKPDAPKENADEKAKTKYASDLKKYETDRAKYQEAIAKWTPADDEKVKAAQAQLNAEIKVSLTKLSPENLKNYDGVIFANTTGDLPLPDRKGFIDWVREGHAFIAMHSGSDTLHHEHGYPPYIEMLGGEFAGHGDQVSVVAWFKSERPLDPA